MVAEDNDDLRAMMPLLINETPGMICAGETAVLAEIAPLIAAQRADVAILDMQLKGGSVISQLPALRSQFPDTRFVIHSGHSNQELIRQVRSAGADAYVLKSGDFDELLATIRQVTAQ